MNVRGTVRPTTVAAVAAGAVAGLAHSGFLGGRFVFPRSYRHDRGQVLLGRTWPVAAWPEARARLADGQTSALPEYAMGRALCLFKAADEAGILRRLARAELNDRLSWAEYLAGNYDRRKEECPLWFREGFFLVLREGDDGVLVVDFGPKG